MCGAEYVGVFACVCGTRYVAAVFLLLALSLFIGSTVRCAAHSSSKAQRQQRIAVVPTEAQPEVLRQDHAAPVASRSNNSNVVVAVAPMSKPKVRDSELCGGGSRGGSRVSDQELKEAAESGIDTPLEIALPVHQVRPLVGGWVGGCCPLPCASGWVCFAHFPVHLDGCVLSTSL